MVEGPYNYLKNYVPGMLNNRLLSSCRWEVLGAVISGMLQSPISVPFLFIIFINVFDKVILDVDATDHPEQEEIINT